MQSTASYASLESPGEIQLEVYPKSSNGYFTSTQIESGIPTRPPEERPSIYRYVRHRLFDVYKRLFTAVFVVNFLAMVWVCFKWTQPTLPDVAMISMPVSVNLFVVVLFRTEDFINILYATVLWFPLSLPLRLRRILARVYQFGGIHSGSAIACTGWTLVFVVQVMRGYIRKKFTNTGIVVLTLMIQVLLLVIVVSAQPMFRRMQHNAFEAIHRFFGWLSLIMFWALLIILSNALAHHGSTSPAYAMFHSPTFYFLLATTLLIILPWLRLRRIIVHASAPSSHLIRFYLPGRKAKPTQTIRLSTSPLLEWHSFAVLPPALTPTEDKDTCDAAESSISVLVSSAGDWTNSVIADKSLTRKYWIRGVPTTGVTAVAQLFSNVVVVCTGSGIGPCLSLLALAKNSKTICHLIWSTQAPEATYGKQVLREVYDVDPEALIWDTRVNGRPDLVTLARGAYEGLGAEAVVVVSNQKVTRMVVFGLESIGVPAFGPVFDS
ncbi:MAG: hypothetical protein MMC23_007463 [Stictis urceolatum]|nr:hypothetical protein [Stictis urceolata]